MELDSRHSVRRFVLPVTLENIGTVLIGLVFSWLVGGISRSALAAIGTVNIILSFYTAFFSLLSGGAAILTARLVGAHDHAGASRVVEQTIFMTVAISALLTVVSLCFTQPILHLVMPTAEPALMREAVRYFRVCALAIIPMMLYTVLMSVLRASGDSRAPMMTTTLQNICQILVGFVFMKLIPLQEVGAGIATSFCRFFGGTLTICITLRSHDAFSISPRNLLKPVPAVIKRLIRLGMPACLESCIVQFGYLLANSLVMGLGTQQAAMYQVANALQSFSSMPQGICSSVSTTFVGQYLGAKDYAGAKKFGYKNLFVSLPISLTLYLVIALLGPKLTPLYTSDPEVAAGAVTCLWVLMAFSLPGQSINTIDSALRAGGDVKFVLAETVIGVWLVRLPLSWLLGYKLGMGIIGIYWANIISLAVRAATGLWRYHGTKWMYKRV